MDAFQDLKAGPSEVQSRWAPENRKWKRQVVALVKALSIVTFLVLAYAAFSYLFLANGRQLWAWELLGSQNGNAGQQENSKGNRYLLGVGKADITG